MNRPEGFEFFEVAAQVIPIFLLVLVFEARLFGRPVFAVGRKGKFLGWFFLCFILTGEVAAFAVLANPDAADNLLYFLLVVIALFSQFTLFMILMTPAGRTNRKRLPSPPSQPRQRVPGEED